MNQVKLGEAEALFAVLRQSADADVVVAIEALVRDAPDPALNRVNVLDFAAKRGLDQERVIAAFLHAARVGLFDLSWNVLCPGCGGVLDANTSLKTVHEDAYSCALCGAGYEPTLDEMVEVSFTVNPRVRKIAAHDPHSLPMWEYQRQIFWSTGIDLPENFEDIIAEIVLDSIELPPGERASLSLQLPQQFVIVFEPVTHSAQFLDVKGEALHGLLGRRRPFLTAKRLLTNQTFRDIYRTDTLDVDQRLKITSLTFLFTDLKGSTELYERVGDLVAFDLVREHFRTLNDIVATEGGAVVKTIGDAVMATFLTPDHALAAALKMREAMRRLNETHGREDLLLKIGIHEGPCLAVNLNERQDYFGQTVNIASRVQGLAMSQSILATAPVVQNPRSASVLGSNRQKPVARSHALRGVSSEVAVYEIPYRAPRKIPLAKSP